MKKEEQGQGGVSPAASLRGVLDRTDTLTEGHNPSLQRACPRKLFLLIGLLTGSGWVSSPPSHIVSLGW